MSTPITVQNLLTPFPSKENFGHGNLVKLLNARFEGHGGKHPNQIKFDSMRKKTKAQSGQQSQKAKISQIILK